MDWKSSGLVIVVGSALLAAGRGGPAPSTSVNSTMQSSLPTGGPGAPASVPFRAPPAPTGPGFRGPSTPVEPTGPTWSDNIHGLRISAQGIGSISQVTYFGLRCEYWNGPSGTVIDFDDLECWSWTVRDAENRIVTPIAIGDDLKRPAPKAVLGWQSLMANDRLLLLTPMPGTFGKNFDTLVFDKQGWKLATGEYTIRGTYTGPSKSPQRFPDVHPWEGKIELPPAAFTVYGKPDHKAMVDAATAIRKKEWPDKGAMYRALAKVVPPGAKFDDLLAVLPRGEGEGANWLGDGNGGVAGTGMVRQAGGSYALDAEFGVQWRADGNGRTDTITSLSGPPVIISRADLEARRAARGRSGTAPASRP